MYKINFYNRIIFNKKFECNFKCNNFMKGIVVLFCLKSVTLNSYEILSVKSKIKTINPVFI